MTVEITSKMLATFEEAALARQDTSAGLAAVLALPEVRQAIHDDVRREAERKLRDLGVTGYSLGWDE